MKKIQEIPNHPNFFIESELGSGGYGSVYKVKDKNNGSVYAIKTINIKQNNKQDIEKEINILKIFNSEYIVKYFDSFSDDNYCYIVMEYCDDSDLSKLIKEHKEKNELIEETTIFNIINSIYLGLKEIHAKNIIHRDFRPKNIFLNKNNKIKIGDFGISKKLVNQKYTTTKKGDYHYMAPEMLVKHAKYNNKVDIWSLGCIIYELFNLETFFDDIFYREMVEGTPQVMKINPKYNQAWLQLLNKILIKKDYNARLKIDEICDFIKNINNNNYEERTNSTSTSSSSLINYNIHQNSGQIFIIFRGDVEFSECFDRSFRLKEMFKILKEKNLINSFDIEKYTIIYRSIILNQSKNLEKPLYEIFRNKNNIVIKIFECGKILGG